jgi:hypothetical protein
LLNTQSNNDVYNVCLKAYNSIDYIAKLVNDNSFNVNEELPIGVSVSYDSVIYIKDQVDIKVVKNTPITSFIIQSTENQSLYDLLAMGYAGVDNAMLFVTNNNLFTVNEGIVDRNSFFFQKKYIQNNPFVVDLLSKGVVYATGFSKVESIKYIGTETRIIITTETGLKFIIE